VKARFLVKSSKLEYAAIGKRHRGAFKKMTVIFPWLKESTLLKIRQDYMDMIGLGIQCPSLTYKDVVAPPNCNQSYANVTRSLSKTKRTGWCG
jgi:hypothetical protein